jgi:hypothetical protein
MIRYQGVHQNVHKVFFDAPKHTNAPVIQRLGAHVEELVRTLQTTEEWRYVDREIDIRLVREPES